jgi:uncharacterized membrane protein (DUF373 family)
MVESSERTADSDRTRFSREQLTTASVTAHLDRFVHAVELAAAGIFALLFAVGVLDLTLEIGRVTLTGQITDPTVVIGLIDTALLLLIIVEVYQTVIAYTRRDETRNIVRLILYTGIIAMVRKVIVFRTGEYASIEEAVLAASAYTLVLLGLGGVLLVERHGTDEIE